MQYLGFTIILIIFCFGCSTPTEKPHKTSIESNLLSPANALTQNHVGGLRNHKIWINDGLRLYNDTVYEIDHSDTLISYNFLKHLHPWIAQYRGSDTTECNGPRYYQGLYLQIDEDTVFSEEIVRNYVQAIDSSYDYYMKTCDERGDLAAGIANWKVNTIVKAYLYTKIQNWNKAEELLIAESKLAPSYYIKLHSIAIPVLYEKYGKAQIMEEIALFTSTETTQYIHGVLFDLTVIRKRFRDKTMTWNTFFDMAFEHYELYGLD